MSTVQDHTTPDEDAADERALLSRTRRARRERLLDVAQALFLRDGYHGTTMERVAVEADVSKATLYKYFTDKDDLLLALVRDQRIFPRRDLSEQMHATVERILAALAADAGADDLEQAVLQLFQQAGERRSDAFFRLMVGLSLEQPELMARIRQEVIEHHPKPNTAAPPEVLARMPLALDPDVLGQLFLTIIMGYFVVYPSVLGDERLAPERLAAGLAALLRQGVQSAGSETSS